ncbi:uncharacterized protein MYCFIDRAFT_78283 [Pseudocercospora fijiensis CIRAD86]|uniref:Uncharacterized protein n=1 Tax=Pseudocercospora fijiensis (strain CIRAD86) TaxID=383855 RepID=M2ZNA7_PSEFD|nr:uncharacterized protein MYCFIDRAFT_78283 [Pseudocercospora fijiensis CIRAD86]EME80584.1 hypothetical protein MYCFIDRAFT_78283 [Pseudocercospora fijiensis CIRAD86]
MGPNFERNPQDGSPSRGDFASYSAYLSSVFNQVTAATPTENVATVTSAAASDDRDNQHTSVPTARTSQSYPETLSRQTQIPVNTYSITTSGSSLPPSTFATATSAGTQTRTPNSATVTAHAENNSSASAFHADHHDDGLSHGELAAAIVVPIITSLSIIVLAIMCLRRRKKTKRASTSSDASRGTKRSFSGAAAGLKEKWGSVRSSASSQHREPVITSASNNAYMTGLDTSLRSNSPEQQQQHHHSGEFYLPNHETQTGEIPPPPPPYILGAPSIPPLTISLPPSRRPSAVDLHDHDHELSHLYLAAPSPAFLDSSARSINSDVYSETASVHSARAARMSIGGPITVPMLNTSKSRATMKDGGKRNSDPFGDPLTPISAMTPVGVRSRQGSRGTG